MSDNFTYEDYYKLFKAYMLCVYQEEYQNTDILSNYELGLDSVNHQFIYRLIDKWKTDNPILFERVQKDYFNNKAKRHRCNKRIEYMLNKDIQNCYFLTLTFNKTTFENLNEDSRRQYVRRYLSKHFSDYVANIDFGEHELEHYHAIGIIKDTDILVQAKKKGRFNLKGFEKGFTDAEPVRDTEDYIKLSSYINKFTNHAFKKANKLIYSRSFKDDETKLALLEQEYQDLSLDCRRHSITELKDFLKKLDNKAQEILELKNKIAIGN